MNNLAKQGEFKRHADALAASISRYITSYPHETTTLMNLALREYKAFLDWLKEDERVCVRCNGHGVLVEDEFYMHPTLSTCPDCNGRGK